MNKIKAWKCSKCNGIYTEETCNCPVIHEDDKEIKLIDKTKAENRLYNEIQLKEKFKKEAIDYMNLLAKERRQKLKKE